MAIDSWDTSVEKLPELGEGQLPPLELSWDVLEEEQSQKNAMKKIESNHEAQNNDVEYIRSEMNRNDETIPILKVRHLRRLKTTFHLIQRNSHTLNKKILHRHTGRKKAITKKKLS
jgi:hypothetical protein